MPYSTNFFAGVLPTSFETLFTVPAGYVAIVRDIEVLNNNADAADISVYAEVPGPATGAIFGDTDLAGGAWTQWRGRVVVPAAGLIVAMSSVSSCNAAISGYLLSSP